MRVTAKSVYGDFQRNLADIQQRRSVLQVQYTTGKNFIHTSDNPDGIAEGKRTTDKLIQNDKYQAIVDETKRELYAVDDFLRVIGDNLSLMRQITIDATPIGIDGKVASLGEQIKGLLYDIVRDANGDYAGKYLFAGTKTTPQSIEGKDGAESYLPFEIVEDEPTPENPSGLRVVFKGNNNDRTINKDAKTTEVINVKPEDLFGQDGVEIFSTIIEIYNTLTYKNNEGDRRQSEDYLVKGDIARLNGLQRKLSEYYDQFNAVAARNGTRIARLESISLQMMNENVRLQDYRSFKEDADIAKVAMDLKREEFALEYALQVGGRLNQRSLFDFLR